jgi:tetratricopeptide (TPR) repeat protein
MSHNVLGAALVLNGQIDEGIAEYEHAQQLHPDAGTLGFLVNAYARKGDRQKALQMLERIKQSSNTPISGYAMAIGYAGLGDKNEAVNWLERSYEEREFDIIMIKVNPLLDPLHGDPRFEALVQKVFAPKKMKAGNFFAELKRRNVYKVAIASRLVICPVVFFSRLVFSSIPTATRKGSLDS